MSRSVICFALVIGVSLVAVSGCFKADVRVPDVSVNTGDYGGRSSNERRMPYAKELEKVLSQQRSVEKELKKHAWEDLSDETTSWVNQTRKLMGKADTSRNPAKMKEYCGQLLKEMETIQRAARAGDTNSAQAALERTNPWLNKLSNEFPLAEPIPESEQKAAPVAP